MTDLSHLRADFPIFSRTVNGQPLRFLDSAASSQKPVQVLEAMETFVRTSYANVHRGAYTLSLEATEAYEAARHAAARFINASTDTEIVLVRGATTALNTIAGGWGRRNLRPGDLIVLTEIEHHANLVPWQMVAAQTGAQLAHVRMLANYTLDLDHLDTLLERSPRLVAVTGMSNVLGTLPPLRIIGERARAAGALVVVDGAQLVPHFPVDVADLPIDALAFSAHKMLGPTGIGVLWARMELLENVDPVEGGGEMISDVTLDSATWAAIPHRFEAGTPPIVEAVGLRRTVEYLEKVGMKAVAEHDMALTAYLLDRFRELPDVTVYGPSDLTQRGGVVSFTLADVHPHDLATILDQHGVAVRAGHHCAKPLHRRLGVPATARASFSVYNDTDDIDVLIEALDEARRLFGL